MFAYYETRHYYVRPRHTRQEPYLGLGGFLIRKRVYEQAGWFIGQHVPSNFPDFMNVCPDFVLTEVFLTANGFDIFSAEH